MSNLNRSSSPITSHGRGGAGNIAPDEKAYTDGEIVREGALGEQGDGAYNSGRGGAGNIESPGLKAQHAQDVDVDVVPETAMRVGEGHERYHVGRGGEGNVHREEGVGGEHEHEHGGLVGKVEKVLHSHDKK